MNNKIKEIRKFITGEDGIKIDNNNTEESETASEIYYNKHFKKQLRQMTLETLIEMGMMPDEQIPKYKGQLEMLNKIREWFESEVNMSLSRFERENEK